MARRRDEVGWNRLEEGRRRHPLLRLLDQFRTPLILLLLGAGVVAFVLGDVVDAIAILTVVTLNGLLGWGQELNAARQVAALRSMIVTDVHVRRGGSEAEVPAEELVPGDVVLLDAGDRVPADGRLLVAERAEVEEAALTGESVPVGKSTAPVEADAPIGDRHGAVWSGSHVTRGRLEMVVVATGAATELGRIAELVGSEDGAVSPLRRQLDDLGRRLAIVAVAAVALLAALGLARGRGVGEVAIEAVAVAAAALPEGLPAVVTVTLTLAVAAMARRKAVVRGLPAVETLGAASVICTDKTGTLTEQRLTVVEVHVDGEELTPTDPSASTALGAFVVASDAANGEVGDPTELALLEAARASGLDVDAVRGQVRRLAEDPFDPTTRRMVVVIERPAGGAHDDAGEVVREVVVKGAPEVLAEMLVTSSRPVESEAGVGAEGAGGEGLVGAGGRGFGPVDVLAERGLRTLAVARRRLGVDEPVEDVEALLHDLEPIGLVALQDPLRPTAAATIAAARRAGIDVVMLTGDHRDTAAAIAAEAGIEGRAVEGRELGGRSDDELTAMVADLGVVARVAPDDKLRIVRAFQRLGRVVAVTGDGANDAAALRAAEVGVALGSGTDVARESADVVLLDDDLGTLMAAVERGRSVHDNLRTFLRFQLTTNASLVLALVAASLAGLAAPMTAAQVLWVNLVADGPPAVALGVDPPKPGVDRRPPRDPEASLLDVTLVRAVIPAAIVMAVAALAAQLVVGWQMTGSWWPDRAPAEATTAAFTAFVLAQVLNAFVVRVGPGRSLLGRRLVRNPLLYASLAVVVTLQVVLVQVPAVNDIARTTALTAGQWGIAVAAALVWPVGREATLAVRRLVRRPATAREA